MFIRCGVVGTGLLKPNISAIVGDLYHEDWARRDAGFSIFYMGINIGAVNATVLRAITHLDIDAVQIEEAGQALLKIVDEMMEAPSSKLLPTC